MSNPKRGKLGSSWHGKAKSTTTTQGEEEMAGKKNETGVKRKLGVMNGTISLDEAVEKFNISKGELRAAVKANEISYIKNGCSTKVRPSFFAEDVSAYIKSKRVPSKHEQATLSILQVPQNAAPVMGEVEA